jgi:hypothetical protein
MTRAAPSSKRESAIAAAQAEAVAAMNASAARTWPISVHLTPFARGCERLAINSPARWKTFYGRTPGQVVRNTLKRLNLTPAECRARAEGTDVALLAGAPPVPHALFWDGLTVDQLAAELKALADQRWTPEPQSTEAA